MDEQSIFLGALERETTADRMAFLDRACAGNEELRQNVELLLKAHQQANDFLARTPAGCDITEVRSVSEKVGDRIGPYRLLQRIGEGGMGAVYLAEQTEPVRRRVALKIIKPGMDTVMVISRFEAERQALAMMDHPNIAKVLDAGATNSGRPYFVMELVQGVPITQYCDQHQLTPRERLAIFATVCRAVQHSHQKGIIHRDIKPSNVLVSDSDGRPVAKVIDFGLAKATGRQLTDKTVFTQYGQIVGTVDYMSPEQANLNPVDVDTRTDIYSLGVLLYELLTGETPFDKKRLRSAAFNELLRIIREEEPPRPSIKLSSSEALPSIAANRHCEPSKLSTLLRGELDWIVMKALEKDRTRRYETANGLSLDIDRYLNDEPVAACPPSAMYRFTKLARRHKAALAATAAILLCLVVGIISTSWQAIRAKHERDRAVAAEKLSQTRFATAQQQRQRAEDATARETRQRLAAEAAREEAKRERNSARGQLSRQYVERGNANLRSGDPASAMPWFVRASRLDTEDQQRARIHRLRLATTLEYCPKPSHVFMHEQSVRHAEFSADGTRVLTVTDQSATVWDARSGNRLCDPIIGQVMRCAHFSPNGDRVVTGIDQELRVWDAASGVPVSPPMSQPRTITCVAFSPDGKWVVAVTDGRGGNSTAQVRDAVTGEPVTPLLPHHESIRHASFSPNGQLLATADFRGLALIWQVAEGKLLQKISLRGSGNRAWMAQFSPDGKSLLTTTDTGVARVWDVQSGEPLAPKLYHEGMIAHGAFSNDGDTIVTASHDQTARIWNAHTGSQTHPPLEHDDVVNHASFSADGLWLVTASADQTARIWNTQTGQLAAPVLRHAGAVHAASFSPDGQWVLTASSDHSARLWEVPPAYPECSLLEHLGPVNCVTYSPDGDLIATGSEDKSARLWDARSGVARSGRLNHFAAVRYLAFSPDGQRLAVACDNGRARVWDVETGVPTTDYLTLSLPISDAGGDRDFVTFDQSGGRVLVARGFQGLDVDLAARAGSGRGQFRVWNVLTGEPVTPEVELPSPVNHASFSPDGTKLVTASGVRWGAGAITTWDLKTSQVVHQIETPIAAIQVWHSPDGNRLLITHGNWVKENYGYAQIRDASSGEPITAEMAHSRSLLFACFSPDMQKVATASWDDTARVWDATSGRPISPPLRHASQVVSVAFSPDNDLVATTSRDGLSFIWDARTGEPVTPRLGYDGTFGSHHDHQKVAFSPHGDAVVTAGMDGTARRWKLSYDTPWMAALPDLLVLFGVPLNEESLFDREQSLAAAWARISTIRTASSIPRQRAGLFRVQCVTDELLQVASMADKTASRASAIKFATRALDISPESPQIWRARAQCYLAQGDHQRAIDDYSRSIELKPNEPTFYAERAGIRAGHQDFGGALEDLSKAIELNPEDPDYWNDRAMVQKSLGNLGKAIEDLNASIELDPKNYIRWTDRGQVRAAMGDWQQAIDDYSKSMELDVRRGQARTWHLRGIAYLQLGQIEAAVADVSQSIAMNAGEPGCESRYQLAMAHLGNGNVSGYQDACQTILERLSDTENCVDANLLAWTCVIAPGAVDDYDPVLRRAQKAVKTQQDSRRFKITLGAALYRSGRYREANQTLADEDSRPKQSEQQAETLEACRYYFLAMSHKALGDLEESARYLTKANAGMDRLLGDRQQMLPWDLQQTLKTLRREAEATIDPDQDRADRRPGTAWFFDLVARPGTVDDQAGQRVAGSSSAARSRRLSFQFAEHPQGTVPLRPVDANQNVRR